MTPADFAALLPVLIVAGAAVVVMLVAAFHRSHRWAMGLTVAALVGALGSLVMAADQSPRQITPLVAIDAQAIFFMGLICAAGLAVALLAYDYWKTRRERPEEFYVLLLLATLGSLVLAASSHFASLFLGLEILSISLYALVAYDRTSLIGIEAGLKYLVLAATSAAFLLMGVAIVYAACGALGFSAITESQPAETGSCLILPAGLALVIVGVGFKLAVVPFHFWTPDVYQGAPAPVTAFIATASKGSMLAAFLRLGQELSPERPMGVLVVLAAVAVASMFVGNLLALGQTNVKRILAYSSIAHLGYVLAAFLASGPLADVAVAYYLTAYFVAMLGAFGVVGLLSGTDREADDLGDYQGLAWRRPWLAAAFSAILLSLAGIPLTAGFVGKFFVLGAQAAASAWGLVVALVASSVIGFYYYLRVMIAMYAHEGPASDAIAGRADNRDTRTRRVSSTVLVVLALLLVLLGVYPSPLLDVAQQMMLGAK